MKTFKEVLSEACDPAVKWVGDKTAEETIDQCHRGDWLLWFAKKVDVDRKLLILTASHCANTVRHLMPEKSKKAVDVFIRYGEGKASEAEFANAEAAARDAADAAADAAAWAARAARAAADAAADAAAWAADAAAEDADAAAWAAWAADAAAWAAYAAAWAAAEDAKEANQKQTADICRKYLKEAILKNLKK